MMDIIKGNKAIHEFMGWKWFDKRFPRNHGIGAPEVFEGTNDIIIQKAKYHSSWDLLMPVVEKIESGGNYQVEIDLFSCYIMETKSLIDNSEILIESHEGKKIDAVWQAVVEFIKKHNSHTQRRGEQ